MFWSSNLTNTVEYYNLYSSLMKSHKQINLGIVGCGKFISMFLSQSQSLKNICINYINMPNIFGGSTKNQNVIQIRGEKGIGFKISNDGNSPSLDSGNLGS